MSLKQNMRQLAYEANLSLLGICGPDHLWAKLRAAANQHEDLEEAQMIHDMSWALTQAAEDDGGELYAIRDAIDSAMRKAYGSSIFDLCLEFECPLEGFVLPIAKMARAETGPLNLGSLILPGPGRSGAWPSKKFAQPPGRSGPRRRPLMGRRLESTGQSLFSFSPFVDVAINGMAAMFVFLAVYIAVVPPRSGDPPPLRIVTERLPEGVWFHGYQTAIVATGGIPPYMFAIEPSDEIARYRLILDPDIGIIAGAPQPLAPADRNTTLTISFSVNVTDRIHQEARASLDLIVNPVAIPFDPERQRLRTATAGARLPDAWLGRQYEYVFGLLGGIEAYEGQAVGLPPGLQFDAAQGRIYGVPTAASIPDDRAERDYLFNVTVEDQQSVFIPEGVTHNPRIERTVRLRVRRVSDIAARSLLPAARVGRPFLGAIVAWGGRGRLRWNLTGGQLPGLQLDGESGIIQGVVNANATARPVVLQFRVSVDDEDDLTPTLEDDYQLTVLPPMRFATPE